MNVVADKTELSKTSTEELEAQNLVENGQFDQAIVIYQGIQPQSGRILHLIGVLYAERKGDQHSAINYFQEALQMKEENGEDTSNTLAELGFAYQNLRDFDLALSYHLRALTLRESDPNVDQKAIASSLLGLANACWGQEDLSQALIYAQQALQLNRSMLADNDRQIAANLAILANIYHHSNDDTRALDFSKQALSVLERSPSPDLSSLVTILNNVGTIQASCALYDDALLTFVRVMHIYEKVLPKGHHKRTIIEDNIRRITEIQKDNVMNLFSHFPNSLTWLLLL